MLKTFRSKKIKIFFCAIKLDIFELSFEYSSEKIDVLSNLVRGLKSRSLPGHLLFSFLYCIRSGIKSLLTKKKEESINDILFFAQGEKHMWALYPVAQHLPNSFIIDNTKGLSIHFSTLKIRVVSLFFIPFLLKKYADSKGYQRRSFKYVFDNYLLIYGNYFVFRSFFQKHPVKALVVANDHSYKCTTMVQAAHDEKIKTFYIQHASVTDKFPPLKFDYALLEGLDALEKYDLCGPSNTKVFLIGMPKLDPYILNVNTQKSLKRLGVCTIAFDRIERVDEILKNLLHDFPALNIVLRPHPGDTKGEWIDMCSKYSLTYSDPLVEESFSFLSKMDAILVSDSSIALEAALLNVYPIYYDFPDRQLDHYGFIRDGLIDKYTNNYDDIRCWIKDLRESIPEIRKRTKRYCTTIDTVFDGKSSQLAAKLITDLCSENQFDQDQWVKIKKSVNIEAYQFKEI